MFLCSSAFAEQWGDFTYTAADNDTITITGYTGSGGAVEIPDTIDSKPVTGIGAQAFFRCISLTSVTIPGSVTSIAYSAFWNCTGLTSLSIGSGVTSIGAYAFERCTGLTTVTIPASVTGIADYAFYNCTGLTRAYFSGNAPEMGIGVFDQCALFFIIHYTAGSTGFTTPWWQGYPATPFNKCPAQQALGDNDQSLARLRFFRDSTLAQSTLGRTVIQIYYNNADSINAALDRSPALRAVTKRVLEVLAPMVGQ
jgi:hypothetical protein